MKNIICFNLVLTTFCLLALTSCSTKYNFVTKGLPNSDSSYIITTAGKHIDATTITIRSNKLMVDDLEYPIADVSVIRSKKMYFAVKDGILYPGEIYRKICLLYRMQAGPVPVSQTGGNTTNGGSPGLWQPPIFKVHYLQKPGSANIDKLTQGSLIDYVADNPKALAKARGSQSWRVGSYFGLAIFGVSALYTLAKLIPVMNAPSSSSSDAGGAAVTAVSLSGTIVSTVISNNKMYKAIDIYNLGPIKTLVIL